MAKKSNYKFQLRGTLIIGSSSVSISNDLETDSVVEFTNEACLLYNLDKTIIERVRATATGGTLTLLKRGMEQDSETEQVSLEKERRDGSYGAMTIFAPQIVDQTADNTFTADNEFTGEVTMSGSFREPVYTDATARDTAIPTPVNGMKVYNTALGLFQKYQAGVRTDDTAGGATPNASETVAGKVELPTSTQVQNETDVGETGASMSVLPSQLSPAILTEKTTVVNGDKLRIADSEDSDSAKYITVERIVILAGVPVKATPEEVVEGTDDTKFVTPLGSEELALKPISGTTYLLAESTSKVTTNSNTYVKLKEIEVDFGGTYRYSVDINATTGQVTFPAIYVNGTYRTGGVRYSSSATDTGSVTVLSGDLVQLYLKSESSFQAEADDFNIKYDLGFNFRDNFTATVNL